MPSNLTDQRYRLAEKLDEGSWFIRPVMGKPTWLAVVMGVHPPRYDIAMVPLFLLLNQ